MRPTQVFLMSSPQSSLIPSPSPPAPLPGRHQTRCGWGSVGSVGSAGTTPTLSQRRDPFNVGHPRHPYGESRRLPQSSPRHVGPLKCNAQTAEPNDQHPADGGQPISLFSWSEESCICPKLLSVRRSERESKVRKFDQPSGIANSMNRAPAAL